MRRHLLSIDDLTAEELAQLVRRSAGYATGSVDAGPVLDGAVVGVYFRRTSTRTRTAFTVATHRLGGRVIAYGPNDLQENTGESTADTGRVLAAMLDGFVARTAGDPAELRTIAEQQSMAVVNAMTADEHPTQAIADLSAVTAMRGDTGGVRICYYGEGNNTAAALALAVARTPGAVLHLRTPRGYGLEPATLSAAHRVAGAHGAVVEESHDADDRPGAVDVLYTTRWQTTGTVKADPDWRRHFALFRVTKELLDYWPGAVFMHDLPAHRGEEVDAEVLDGPRSIAFEQAAHKLYSAMAVLEWTVAGPWR